MARTDESLDREASVTYRRTAPLYDLIDFPFEVMRYRRLRRMIFAGLSGQILDAGVGTGRNIPYYPIDARVTGIDLSPEMLARARVRRERAGRGDVILQQGDLRDTGLPSDQFDTVVASFVLCVLPESDRLPALGELARLVKPGGEIRLLEYTNTRKPFRRALKRLWQPLVKRLFGASLDLELEALLAETGLEVVEVTPVVSDIIRLARLRRPR